MPELPEVETVKRILESKLTGATINQIEILNQKSFVGDLNQILHQKIVGFSRLGKQLSIHLENKKILLVHLKMTGQLIFTPSLSKRGKGEISAMGHPTKDMYTSSLPNNSTRVVFHLSFPQKRESILYFNDQRKFGWIKIMTKAELLESQKNIGLDIIDPSFTFDYFYSQLQKTSRPIKVTLLDQNKFAGIGNIYA